MILEVGLGVALLAFGERAYKAYKNGTLLTDVTSAASTLKGTVVSVESKLKAAIPVVEADAKALIADAKAVLAKVGL